MRYIFKAHLIKNNINVPRKQEMEVEESLLCLLQKNERTLHFKFQNKNVFF